MKKMILLIVISLLFNCFLYAENINALVMMSNNYGANYFCFYEMFEQLGWDITTAAISDAVQPCSAYAGLLGCPPVSVDILITDISDLSEFDCIMIMSASSYVGNPCIELINNQHVLDLITEANVAEKLIWATCSGIRVLAAANVLQGVDIQGPTSYNAEFLSAGANIIGTKIPPVVDGNIITTMRGQYYMQQNIFAILSTLQSLGY